MPWTMQPRLRLDIGWRDLLSALPPVLADRATLERRIAASAPPGATAVVGLSVRTLFDALLAETAAGRPVAMSAVTIADMAALVRAHGSPLRPLDIDLDALRPPPADLAQAEADAVLVVLAALYGPRPTFDDLALRPNGPLRVEDRAQAFDGALTLSPGADVALYSFGPIKTATALGGGIALFRDPGLAARIARRLTAYPDLSEAWFMRRIGKHALLKAVGLPPIYALLMRGLARDGRDPDAAIGAAARGFPGSEPIHLAVRRQPPLRMLRLLARRLDCGRPRPDPAIAAAMTALSQRLPVPGGPGGARWLLPVLHSRPAALIEALRRRGFDATRGATSLRAVAADGAPPPPSASRLIDQVVYLPKPRTAAGADRLVRALDAALKET